MDRHNLTLREVLNDINNEISYKVIAIAFLRKAKKLSGLDNLKEGDMEENVRTLFNELLSLPKKDTSLEIDLSMYFDFDRNGELYCSYDTSCTDDKNMTYGLEFIEWSNLIDARISSKSMFLYGLLGCVTSTLYDMSYYGYTIESNKTAINNLYSDLKKAEEDSKKRNGEFDFESLFNEVFSKENESKEHYKISFLKEIIKNNEEIQEEETELAQKLINKYKNSL